MIKLMMSCWMIFLIFNPAHAENTVLLLPEDEGLILNAHKAVDYYIPDDTQLNSLTLTLRGGDGGYRYGYPLDFSGSDGFNLTKKTYYGKGGGGAMLINAFKVGLGEDEIPPGAILRFIPGEAGMSANDLIYSCGSGGGGSAVLFKKHITDPNWTILAVAAGGGGAVGTSSSSSSLHGGNGVGWEASCQFGECDNRICASEEYDNEKHDDDYYNSIIGRYGSGGGAFTLRGDLTTGKRGYPSGNSGGKDDWLKGGFGFGSGGAERGLQCHSGGGGGYCGGLSGRKMNTAGYGGSSYINPAFSTHVTSVRADGVRNHTTTQGYVAVKLHTMLVQDDFETFPVNIIESNIDEKNDVVSLTQGNFEAVIGKEENLSTANLLKSASLTDVSYLLLDAENPLMQLYHEEQAFPEQIATYRETIAQCTAKVAIEHASFTTNAQDNVIIVEMTGQYHTEGTLVVSNATEVKDNNAAPVIECEATGEVSTIDTFASIHYDRWKKELTLTNFLIDGAILENSNLTLGAFN